MQPTYLELAYEGNYVGRVGTIELWQLHGEIYAYGRMTGFIRQMNYIIKSVLVK